MFDEKEIEFLLQTFHNRVGKIRGSTVEEKVQSLANRYSKIVEDCRKEYEAGFDVSNYRSAYAVAHENAAEILSDMELDKAIWMISELLSSKLKNPNPTSSGYIDAYAYILAEIKMALEESDV